MASGVEDGSSRVLEFPGEQTVCSEAVRDARGSRKYGAPNRLLRSADIGGVG
jgi:hypothetical protein